MYIRYLILIFAQFLIIYQIQVQAQQDSTSPTPTAFASSNSTQNGSSATITQNVVTDNNSKNNGSQTFLPSPTSFIFTHFPSHTQLGSSTSIISSARPSQSAPYPDDTIGKNGRLNVSSASSLILFEYETFIVLIACLLLVL
ncbi:MAG: hypothetical protein EXX96DRAFT_648414 [Benjaminiella poitrasii]|nr:MAG: hypothetical protein EXX96DRAFT_648414 [Benjaminiella poitrasii]